MTVSKRGKDGICSVVFQIEGQTHCFTFNGKKGMPLITDKRLAKEKEVELKKQIRMGTFLQESPVQNFGRFYKEVFMHYSKDYKSELGQDFDEYYGRRLIEEFGHLKFSQITPRQIERFLMNLAKTKTKQGRLFAPVTVRMFYERLNRTFNLARRERVFLGENPCRMVNAEILKSFPTWRPRERWLNQHDDEEEQKLFNELSPVLSPLCRILLHTGLRPPKEILLMEKDHVNLTDKVLRYKGDKMKMIPPHSVFVANGKDGTTRMVPLNQTVRRIFEVLVGDETTGRWLFAKNGQPIKSIKKGFSAACERAGIEDLRPYDLRHTFATRLVERNVQTIIISELLGHTQPLQGFGHASRITPGYAHATYDAMRRAVDSLEYPPQITAFEQMSSKNRANDHEVEVGNQIVKAG
ncbi:MAG: tyrosine-type recombinase/integrase [Acidobacteria bacterium]|nr:tyrosine-type recombinase/integrase [Acidobacteriota bacterium]